MTFLPGEVTITSRCAPESAASVATSSMPGVSTTGSNSLGTVLRLDLRDRVSAADRKLGSRVRRGVVEDDEQR